MTTTTTTMMNRIVFAVIVSALIATNASVNGAPLDHDHKEEIAGSENMLSEKPSSERQVITYDQRQEGKFNVRADLENFVIVFVPSSPSQGMNILELLSNIKRSSQSKHASQRKRIHAEPQDKDSNTIEINKETAAAQYSQAHIAAEHQFIEGRTPYRVDINSEPGALSHLHPEVVRAESMTTSPVLNLMKQPAGALSVEQPTVQITEGKTKSRMVRSLNGDVPRDSFAAESNSVVLFSGSSSSSKKGSSLSSNSNVVDFSSGDGMEDRDLFIQESSPYLRQLTDPIHSFDSLISQPPPAADDQYVSDDWRLLGSPDREACGPEMRRDSYGVCRYYPTNF